MQVGGRAVARGATLLFVLLSFPLPASQLHRATRGSARRQTCLCVLPACGAGERSLFRCAVQRSRCRCGDHVSSGTPTADSRAARQPRRLLAHPAPYKDSATLIAQRRSCRHGLPAAGGVWANSRCCLGCRLGTPELPGLFLGSGSSREEERRFRQLLPSPKRQPVIVAPKRAPSTSRTFATRSDGWEHRDATPWPGPLARAHGIHPGFVTPPTPK